MSRQLVGLNHLLGDMQRRLFALERAAEDAKADLITARQIDEQLAEVLDGLLEDLSGR